MATRLKISRSKVSADTIASQREREEARLAAEGYRFYAQEASEFAAASQQAVLEVLAHLNPASCILHLEPPILNPASCSGGLHGRW
jgi:hypothetical protein